MNERVVLFFALTTILLALVACTDASGPIEGSSRTPSPTGAESLPSATATSDVPDAKLTAVAAVTPAPSVSVSATCPVDARQCDFAAQLDRQFAAANFNPLLDLLTLSPMTCPTFEDFLHFACEGRPGQQVEAFFFSLKLGMFLSPADARTRLADLLGSIAPARATVAAVGCPVQGDFGSAFAIVLRWQVQPGNAQGLILSVRTSTNGWLIDSAHYLIDADRNPALSNGRQPVVANGKDVEYIFTRWQP